MKDEIAGRDGTIYPSLTELSGIRLVVDNRIKFGKLRPHKKIKGMMRCSQKTLDAIKGEVNKQNLSVAIDRRFEQYYDPFFLPPRRDGISYNVVSTK
jgi:hypothetical protein